MALRRLRIPVDMTMAYEAVEELELLVECRAVPKALICELEHMVEADDLLKASCIGGRWEASPSARLTALIGNLRACAVLR